MLPRSSLKSTLEWAVPLEWETACSWYWVNCKLRNGKPVKCEPRCNWLSLGVTWPPWFAVYQFGLHIQFAIHQLRRTVSWLLVFHRFVRWRMRLNYVWAILRAWSKAKAASDIQHRLAEESHRINHWRMHISPANSPYRIPDPDN